MNTEIFRQGSDGWLARETVADHQDDEPGLFYFGNNCADGSLNRVLAALIAIRESIPEPYRANARCEIGVRGERYDSGAVATVKVSYTRPATDEEIGKQRETDRRRVEWAIARKSAELQHLRARLQE